MSFDTSAVLSQRIEDLEEAIASMKTGVIMGPLRQQLDIDFNVGRCKWVAAGFECRTFAAALEYAIGCQAAPAELPGE